MLLMIQTVSSPDSSRLEMQEEKFKDREDIMKAKNAELEESLIRFSKYLQENDAKRAIAFKKAADERRLCDEKSIEAEELVSATTPCFWWLWYASPE